MFKTQCITTCFAFVMIICGCASNLNDKLIRAAREGDTEDVVRLIEAGADVEARDNDGITAFIAASSNGHLETVDALKAAGAKRTVLRDN
jgi:ankyrin repeat protein